jgi:hypothetical protein
LPARGASVAGEFGDPAKNDGENDHRQKWPDNCPENSDDGLLVAYGDIAPGQDQEKLPVSPEFCPVVFSVRPGSRMRTLSCIKQFSLSFCNNLTTFLHQVSLFGFIRDIGKGLDIAGKFPDFGKCFNNGQSGLNCLRAFKNSGQYIQTFCGERGWINCRMLQLIEPVEIFHQFTLFLY